MLYVRIKGDVIWYDAGLELVVCGSCSCGGENIFLFVIHLGVVLGLRDNLRLLPRMFVIFFMRQMFCD